MIVSSGVLSCVLCCLPLSSNEQVQKIVLFLEQIRIAVISMIDERSCWLIFVLTSSNQLLVYSCPVLYWDLKTPPWLVLGRHLITKQKGRFVPVSSPTSIFFPLHEYSASLPFLTMVWKQTYL
jgi:hypothetical protein